MVHSLAKLVLLAGASSGHAYVVSPVVSPCLARRASPVRVSLSVDPFADPVFNAAAAAADAVPPEAAQPHSGVLVTGIAIYLVTMALLTAWDEWAVPALVKRGILPNMPGSLSDIRRRKEEIFGTPWVTPLTANTGGMPLPSLQSLMKKAYRVGKANGVVQYIRAHATAASEAAKKSKTILMESAGANVVSIPARAEEDATISDELGVCRLSPDWTAHYGHRVYICKRKE